MLKARAPGTRLRASLVCAGGLVAAVAAVALMAAVGNLVPNGTARPEAKLLVEEAPAPRRARSFAIVNPESFRPRRAVGLMRVAPFRALYSASLGTDPQQFLQKAPEQGHLGMFRWEAGRQRGSEGESLPRAVPTRPAPRTLPHRRLRAPRASR
jgi:hypothetical protein